jgi:hypothetical protein
LLALRTERKAPEKASKAKSFCSFAKAVFHSIVCWYFVPREKYQQRRSTEKDIEKILQIYFNQSIYFTILHLF